MSQQPKEEKFETLRVDHQYSFGPRVDDDDVALQTSTTSTESSGSYNQETDVNSCKVWKVHLLKEENLLYRRTIVNLPLIDDSLVNKVVPSRLSSVETFLSDSQLSLDSASILARKHDQDAENECSRYKRRL